MLEVNVISFDISYNKKQRFGCDMKTVEQKNGKK